MKQNGIQLKVWYTWDYRKILIDEMSHQHMSNLIHFFRWINPTYPKCVIEFFKNKINEKFNGDILEWKPDSKFKDEKLLISTRGWLKPNGDIVIHGEKIGSYERS